MCCTYATDDSLHFLDTTQYTIQYHRKQSMDEDGIEWMNSGAGEVEEKKHVQYLMNLYK